MNNFVNLIICKLGNLYIPNLQKETEYIFAQIANIQIIENSIPVGEADYQIGNIILEYSVNYINSIVKANIPKKSNQIIIAFINERIEKNYFSHILLSEQMSIISLEGVERLGVDLEKFMLFEIIAHYIVHNSKTVDWHEQTRRCLFDFCRNKEDMATKIRYFALCDECSHKMGVQENKIINRVIDVINKNMKKKEILFMAANPSGSTLRLDQEARDVEQHITRIARFRNDFQFRKTVATTINDLQQELLDNAPHYLHFAGHGEDSGIYLNDSSGNYQLVETAPLARLFSLYADKIQCVFLNSCYSEAQAVEINKHIPFVIGMRKAVSDKVAIQFATSFYQAIAAGREIQFAFDLAKNSIELYGLKGSEIPVLHRSSL